MRKNKSGEPAIPKATWSFKAHMHREFANELLGIAKAAGTFGEALLQPTIDRHLNLADACDELYSEVAKGRPKKAVVNQLAAMFPTLTPPPKKPGRPPKFSDVDMDELTYRVVEKRRIALSKSSETTPKTRAVINSLTAELALASNTDKSKVAKVVKDSFESVHSAYKRGKKQAEEKGQN